jgi:hypothetical protein
VLEAFGGSWRWPFALVDGLLLASAGALGVSVVRLTPGAGRLARALGLALALLGIAAAVAAGVVALAAAVGLAITVVVGLALLAVVILAIALSGGF